MKLTRKGYLVVSGFLLILILAGGVTAYIKSPAVRAWVKDLSNSSKNGGATPAPTNTPVGATPAATATPTNATTTTNVADAEIKVALLQAVVKNAEWRKHSIDVDVQNGVVTLRGAISSEATRDELTRFVHGIAGVKTVQNNLEIKTGGAEVAPGNNSEDPDDRLAKEVEFACYKTDAFDLHAIQISAKNGQVLLRGRVRSRAEQLLAERVAREVTGVRGVTNQLEIGEP